MIGMHENKVISVPLVEAVATVRTWFLQREVEAHLHFQTKAVAVAIGERNFEKAMSLRDPEFHECLEGFSATSTLETVKLLPESKVCGPLFLSAHSLFSPGCSECVLPSCSKRLPTSHRVLS